MPEQGYNEHSDPTWVVHSNGSTAVGDWHQERPRMQGETHEGDSTLRVCQERPKDPWCQLFLKDHATRGRGVRRIAQSRTVVRKAASERAAKSAEGGEAQSAETSKATGASAQGVVKGLRKTVDQAEEAVDRVGGVLPVDGAARDSRQGRREMADSRKKTSDQAGETADRVGDAATGDGAWFPPGMFPR